MQFLIGVLGASLFANGFFLYKLWREKRLRVQRYEVIAKARRAAGIE